MSKIVKMTDYCNRKGKVHLSEMTPQLWFVENLIRNIVMQFSPKMLENALVNLGWIKKGAFNEYRKDMLKNLDKVS